MTAQKETREEFEARYNGGHAMPWIRRGRLSIECHDGHAGEDAFGCKGWQMSALEWLDDAVKLHGNTQEEVDAAIAHRNELLAKDAE